MNTAILEKDKYDYDFEDSLHDLSKEEVTELFDYLSKKASSNYLSNTENEILSFCCWSLFSDNYGPFPKRSVNENGNDTNISIGDYSDFEYASNKNADEGVPF